MTEGTAKTHVTKLLRNPHSHGNDPIELQWAYSYDKGVRNGVHSLAKSPKGPKAVFFPASNTGVMHRYAEEDKVGNGNGTQVLLRGHTNRISAVAVSNDREWIATGDIGQVHRSTGVQERLN